MRMAFGLIGILVTLGVIVWVLSWTLGPIGQNLHTGKVKKEEARQIAGYDESGIKASRYHQAGG